MKLYDAHRCPYCARVRIGLAEKGLEYESVAVDLSHRPAWLYELNETGKVPVLDDDGFILPESEVILAYLDERFRERPLLPESAQERAAARLAVHRFDDLLGDDYYAFRRGDANRLGQRLEALELGRSLFEDVSFAPWVMRTREKLGIALPARLDEQLERLLERPAFAAELEIVRSL